MITSDLFGRQVELTGDIASYSKAMMDRVNTVVQTEAPTTDEKLDNLYDAVNDVSVHVDRFAAQELNSAQQFLDAIKKLEGSLGRGTATQEPNRGLEDQLNKMAQAQESLAAAVHDLNIDGFTDAQDQINKNLEEACKEIRSASSASSVSSGGEEMTISSPTTASAQDVAKAMIQEQKREETKRTDVLSRLIDVWHGSGSGSGSGSGGGGTGGGAGGGAGGPDSSKWEKLGMSLQIVVSSLHMMNKKFSDSLGMKTEHLWPKVEDENRFRMITRDVVFMTQGMDHLDRSMEQVYMTIDKNIKASGVKRADFQNVWLGNLERGLAITSDLTSIQDQATRGQISLEKAETRIRETQVRRMKSVTTSALNTAKMLNMEMNFVNELFVDWHMQLGLSSLSLADMGRAMQDIAKSTGLTGSKLQNSIKSSSELVDHMQRMGNLSDTAAKNIMGFGAAFEKYGVSEQMMPVFKSLTSGKDFAEAEDHIKVMLGRAANLSGDRTLLGKIVKGQILHSKKDINTLFKGHEKSVRTYLEQWETSWDKVDLSAKDMDLKNMDQAIAKLTVKAQELEDAGDFGGAEGLRSAILGMNMTSKGAIGMEMGEVSRTTKAVEEAGFTKIQMMEKINKELQNMQNSHLQKTAAYAKQEANLMQMRTSGHMEMLSAIHKMDGDVSKAQTLLKGEWGEGFVGQFDAKNMSGSLENVFIDLRKQAELAGTDLDKVLKKRGIDQDYFISGMTDALGKKDMIGFGGFAEELNLVRQELDISAKTKVDPVTQILEVVRDINSKMGSMLGGILTATVGSSAVLVGLMFFTSQIGSFVGALANFKLLPSLLFNKLFKSGGVLGKGGFVARQFVKVPRLLTGTFGKIWSMFKGTSGLIARAFSGVPGMFSSLTSRIGNMFKGAPGFLSNLFGRGGLVAKGFSGTGRLLSGTFGRGGFIARAFSGVPGMLGGLFGRGGMIASAFSGIAARVAPMVTATGGALSSAGGYVAAGASTAGGVAARGASLIGRGASAAGVMAKGASGILGKLAGPLQGLIGGIIGGIEAEKMGQKFSEGAGIGALTGDASSGSMFSGMLGLEKGGAADKTMGVAGAAGYGAMLGTAIGAALAPFTAGISLPVAAAIGAVAGAAAELLKILGEKFEWVKNLTQGFLAPLGAAIEGIWNMIKGVGNIIAGIFTLDLGRIGKGIKQVLWDGLVMGVFNIIKAHLWDAPKYFAKAMIGAIQGLGSVLYKVFDWTMKSVGKAAEWIVKTVLNLPSLILKGLNYLAGLPVKMMDWIIGGLEGLKDHDLLGPIIKPVLGFAKALRGVFAGIKKVFEALLGAWTSIKNVILTSLSPAFEFLKGGLASIGKLLMRIWDNVLLPIAKFIGGVFGAIWKGLMWVLEGVWKVLGPVIKIIGTGLYLALKGILHVAGFLLKTALWPFQKALEGIGWVLGKVADGAIIVGEFMAGLVGAILKPFKWLWDVLVGHSIIPDLVMGIVKWFMMLPIKIPLALAKMAGKMVVGLGKLIWSGIKGIPSLLKKVFWDFPKWLGKTLWSGIKTIWSSLFGGGEGDAEGGGLVSRIMGWLWEGFTAIPKLIWSALTSLPGLLWDAIKGVGGLVMGALGGIGSGLKAILVDFPAWIGGKIMEGIKGIGSFIGDMVTGAWDGIKAGASWVKDKLIEGAGYVKDKFAEFGSWLYNKAIDALGKVWSWLTGKVDIEEAAKEVYHGLTGSQDIVNNINSSNEAMTRMQEGHAAAMQEKIAATSSADAKVEEIQRQLATGKITLQGSKKNAWSDYHAIKGNDSKMLPNWAGVDSGYNAARAAYLGADGKSGSLERYKDQKIRIAGLQKQLEAAKKEQSIAQIAQKELAKKDPKSKEALDAAKTTAEVMELGKTKGSIFVHDTHVHQCIETLTRIVSNLAKFLTGSKKYEMAFNSANMLKTAFQGKKESERSVFTSLENKGAFENGQAKEATEDNLVQEIKKLSIVASQGGQAEEIKRVFGDNKFNMPKMLYEKTDSTERILDRISDSRNTSENVISNIVKLFEAYASISNKANERWNASYEGKGAFDKTSINDAFYEGVASSVLSITSKTNLVNGEGGSLSRNSLSRDTGTSIGSTISSDTYQSIKGSSVVSSISKLHDAYQQSVNREKERWSVSHEETGAFSKTSIKDAFFEGIADKAISLVSKKSSELLSSVVPPAVTEKLTRAIDVFKSMVQQKKEVSLVETGAFDSKSAMPDALSPQNVLNELISLSSESQEKTTAADSNNIIAELSRSLDYEKTASEAAEKTSAIFANSMDYRDSLRPLVSTLLTSRTGTEENLERRKYGDEASTATLPSMDEVADYLTHIQAAKLEEMTIVLKDIRDSLNTGGGTGSTVIGPSGRGTKPIGRPSVKSIAQDYVRGELDLTWLMSSPGSVTTEGRGGK